jgi:hypothetical protein
LRRRSCNLTRVIAESYISLVNPALLRCRVVAIVVAELSVADLFALTGCVYPGGEKSWLARLPFRDLP